MAERGYNMDDVELGERLRDLGRQWHYPPTPDLAPAVQARIQSRAGSSRQAGPRSLRPLFTGATLLALLCVAVLAIPATRSAVATWLDLPGVTLVRERSEDQPVLGGALRLGAPVALAEVRGGVRYAVLVPDLDWLGAPDEVYLDAVPVGGAVSFIYHADAALPPAETTGVGLLISQFQGQLNPGLYGKGLPDGVQLETFEIKGQPAFWISGEPHRFSYFDPDGRVVEETQRLAGNTLLWQNGKLTLRLESSLDREQAVQIAESMR